MCQMIINECKRTCAHWLMCTCSLFIPYARKYSYLSLCLLLPHSSSVSKIGKSVTSSADGDNKLVEEPITSRWQAGGSGLSTCHYLHIDISKSPDRPFLRLPRQATMINPGKRKEGRKKTLKKPQWECLFTRTQCGSMWVHIHGQKRTCYFLVIYTFRHIHISSHLLPPPQRSSKIISFTCKMVIVFL